MTAAIRPFAIAVAAALVAAWAVPRAQPVNGEFARLAVDDFIAAGEVKMFSTDANPDAAGSQCPDGWERYSAMDGRYPIAVTTTGVLAGPLGGAYADSDGPVRRGGTGQSLGVSGGGSFSGSFSGSRTSISIPSQTGSVSGVSASFRGQPSTVSISVPGSSFSASFSGNTISPSASFTRPSASFRGNSISPRIASHSHVTENTTLRLSVLGSAADRGTSRTWSVSQSGTTRGATIRISAFTPSGSVSVSGGRLSAGSFTPSGSVSISGSATGSASVTPSGTVSIRGGSVSVPSTSASFTPQGSISGSVGSRSLSTSSFPPPAPAVQLLFCRALA